MKNLGARQSYNISNLDVSGRAYAELALGHSHSISENLNIGAKVKVLVGLANVNAHVDNMDVVMNGDKWSITAQGNLNSSVPGLVIPTKGETGATTAISNTVNTVPIYITKLVQSGDYTEAAMCSIVLIAICFVIMLVLRLVTSRRSGRDA